MAVTHGDNSDNADDAARAAGVVIRELSTLDEIAAVRALLDRIWQPGDETDPPIGTEIIRALSHAGNYLAGAYDGEALVAASVGFFGAPPGEVLHSHVTGVAPHARGRRIGYGLKLHQAAWAARRGLAAITWTFDPLIRRNAYFNFAKLGATVSEYHVDFYADVDDAVNGGQGSDRLLAHWDLRGERPPPRLDAPAVAVTMSTGGLLVDGATIVGLTRDGHYQVIRNHQRGEPT